MLRRRASARGIRLARFGGLGGAVLDLLGDPPGWGRAALRWFLPAIGYVAMFFPDVVIQASFLWDPHRKGWHDRAAGTLVVQT